MDVTPDDVRIVVAALQDSQWDHATVVFGDVTITVGRNGAGAPPVPAPSTILAPAPAAASPAAAQPPAPTPGASSLTPGTAVQVPGGRVITAPSIGVFWRAPQPGAPAFIEVGSRVAIGDTLCIVEVMKLMHNITSDVAGVVAAIHAENAQPLEYGSPMVTIIPDAA